MRARVIAIAGLLATPHLLMSQQRAAIKRGVPVVARQSCPAMTAPRGVTDAQRRDARDMAQKAQQSAILGDRAAARDQLKQAASLDPANADLAYQLARAQEAAGVPDAAALEYCRFLSLTPNAPESSEARERVAALVRPSQQGVPDRVLAPFRAGIAAYEAGHMPQAEAGFSAAIALQPNWADAYYDRALARVAQGARDPAIRDLQEYLRLVPDAEDRRATIARIDELRGSLISPGTALAAGLVIPGAGQFYTERKLLGVATLGIATGTLLFAARSTPVVEMYQATALDPFGQTYTYTATRTVVGRPYLKRGVVGVGIVAVVSAVEASFYARRLNAGERRLTASLAPSADGMALRVSLR